MYESFRSHAVAYIETMPKEQLKEWMAQQVYIALGFLLSACAVLNIDACPIEAFDRDKVNNLLGLDKYGMRTKTFVHRTAVFREAFFISYKLVYMRCVHIIKRT